MNSKFAATCLICWHSWTARQDGLATKSKMSCNWEALTTTIAPRLLTPMLHFAEEGLPSACAAGGEGRPRSSSGHGRPGSYKWSWHKAGGGAAAGQSTGLP